MARNKQGGAPNPSSLEAAQRNWADNLKKEELIASTEFYDEAVKEDEAFERNRDHGVANEENRLRDARASAEAAFAADPEAELARAHEEANAEEALRQRKEKIAATFESAATPGPSEASTESATTGAHAMETPSAVVPATREESVPAAVEEKKENPAEKRLDLEGRAKRQAAAARVKQQRAEIGAAGEAVVKAKDAQKSAEKKMHAAGGKHESLVSEVEDLEERLGEYAHATSSEDLAQREALNKQLESKKASRDEAYAEYTTDKKSYESATANVEVAKARKERAITSQSEAIRDHLIWPATWASIGARKFGRGVAGPMWRGVKAVARPIGKLAKWIFMGSMFLAGLIASSMPGPKKDEKKK